ncbi:MAG: NADH-quinone oxidoreductase subunit H [candidate division Zixibacteria bacterium RBG-1]|nr:MAG: NADH-quinone oxidoreductase subunit H [candidate division Zixibacteria bacterium RBG-1]OGC85696.1 MAG: NADH-quinone oxidoreductase subunit H [candidate division Zixibacteria bacterium RBG_19FT_COMBO_42_43]
MNPTFLFILITVIKVVVIVHIFMFILSYLTWAERKLLGHIQARLGPKNVGPFGLLQPIADGIKLLFKEDIIPAQANKILFVIAPVLSFIPALIVFAVIPFGDKVTLFGQEIDLIISDINVGLLYIFAITALGVYGIAIAGWASNSKYSLLGGLRSMAQMISYEVSYTLSIVGILMLAGSLSLVDIVKMQDSFWHMFIFKQPLAFLIYLICGIAETNRAPFDLPEAETELVAGFHTEYSSMKFGMFSIAEYANVVNVSAIATTLFLGGWQGPYLPPVVWFLLKMSAFLFLFIWLRATLPRFRYDQLMKFGWQVLLPLALLNILITAVIMII